MALLIPDRPWAITQASYEQVLDVINRHNLNLGAAREKRDDHAIRAVNLYGGKRIDGARYMTQRDGVAIIDVYGPIARRANLFMDISGGTSIDFLARDVQAALDMPTVKSLLLVFDSPGGEVTGVSELAAAIYAARGRKPIHAYVDGMACSAGYWLASACDHITINDTALLGSIGVVMALPDPEKTNSKDIEFVSSQSPNKRPNITTDAGREQIQTMLDALADVFVHAVATHRAATVATVLADFGAGGVFVGRNAITAGLADEAGSFESALAQCFALNQSPRGVLKMTDHDRELQAGLIVPPDPRVAELEKQITAMREQYVATNADAFVNAQLASHRIVPAAGQHLRAAYVALAGLASTAPLAALESFCTALTPHTLTDEQVPAGAVALGNHTGVAATAQEAHAEEVASYLAKVVSTSTSTRPATKGDRHAR